jgi:hypothetical protein
MQNGGLKDEKERIAERLVAIPAWQPLAELALGGLPPAMADKPFRPEEPSRLQDLALSSDIRTSRPIERPFHSGTRPLNTTTSVDEEAALPQLSHDSQDLVQHLTTHGQFVGPHLRTRIHHHFHERERLQFGQPQRQHFRA